MLKETITPKESIYPLLIPANYIGKTVEGEKFQEYVSNSR